MSASLPPDSGRPDDPAIAPSQSVTELTIKAVTLGFLLSVILAGANAYLGLKVGMTVSASIPAAVISMGLFRVFFRGATILENNVVQTAASAGESVAAGVIFTIPALILLGYWQSFEFWPIFAIAAFGGILGVLFTVPLRRALIVEAKLQFPEGVATAEVLKSGHSGGKAAAVLGIAAIAGAAIKLCQTGFRLASDTVAGSVTAGRSMFGFASNLGPALLAVGYIVGLNIATLVFAGGLISWLFAIPLFTALADPATVSDIVGDTTGYAAAEAIWNAKIRYLGVGAMATGGLWALIALIKPVGDGIRASLRAIGEARSGTAAAVPRTERDTPIHIVGLGIVILAIPIFLTLLWVIDRNALGISSGLYAGLIAMAGAFSLIAGFVFSSVAGYMAGLVGSSNNPISGITIATLLTVSLILAAVLGTEINFGEDGGAAIVAAGVAILVGAVVCCAAAIAGDNLQDLKSGHVIGATPWKQQIAQMVGVVGGALIIGPVLELLFSAYGLGGVVPREGMDTAEALQAPQATLMKSVAEGVFAGGLPWNMVAIGAVIAVAIIIFDKILEARGAKFRAPVLAVAVGIYLPIGLSVPIFVGGVIAHIAARAMKQRGASEQTRILAARRGLLFSAGLITGEALIGIGLAIPFAATQSTDIMALPVPESVASVVGVAAFAALAWWLYRVATRSGERV